MLANPQLLRDTKNKERCLGHHKGFKRQPRASTELKDKVHPLQKATLSRLGEVAVLSNAQKPTERIKENEETKENVPKEKRR